MGRRALRGWIQLAVQVGLLVVAAGLIQTVAERTNRRFDFTVRHDLSLSDVTRRVLAGVTSPLRITVFYDRGNRAQYAGLLSRIRAVNPAVETELYDLDRYPERARAMGVTQYGRAVIEYEGRRAVALAHPEEQIVGGVLKVLRAERLRLAFTVGHGERVPSADKAGYGRLAADLETESYRVEPLPIAAEPVPAGVDVLLVAGPTLDFAPETVARVVEFLRAGGGVLLAIDPGALPNLRAALSSVGVDLGENVVVDRERRVLATDGLAAVVEFFRRGNPITEAVDDPIESGVVLPSARTVDVTGDPPPGVDLASVARTGPGAFAIPQAQWAERGAEPSRIASDAPGPLSVMVMGEVGTGRLVVIGDADFASDAYFDLLGNGHLALNAIAWVAAEDRLRGGRAKHVPEVPRPLSPLVITAGTARRLLLLLVVVQPALVLLAGIVIVSVRRWRG
jgi:gliding motility-associatede transport system auxiliary component